MGKYWTIESKKADEKKREPVGRVFFNSIKRKITPTSVAHKSLCQ
jgi:hypothetical protein